MSVLRSWYVLVSESSNAGFPYFGEVSCAVFGGDAAGSAFKRLCLVLEVKFNSKQDLVSSPL